jgi:hypothetical protein
LFFLREKGRRWKALRGEWGSSMASMVTCVFVFRLGVGVGVGIGLGGGVGVGIGIDVP